jgi:hypothetical protein
VSSGYQVVMSDLASMASAFKRESTAFDAIMPVDGPPCPDGGDGDINQAMRGAVQMLGVLHKQMAEVISQHGTRLQTAHDNYEHTETGLTKLSTLITNADAV